MRLASSNARSNLSFASCAKDLKQVSATVLFHAGGSGIWRLIPFRVKKMSWPEVYTRAQGTMYVVEGYEARGCMAASC